MDSSGHTMQNPVQVIASNTPPVVWNYYMDRLSDKLSEMNISQSEKSNFKATIIRYANGERGSGALRTMNIFLRKALQASWPVSNTFFEGNRDEMDAEAYKSAAAMIDNFKGVLSEQIAALPL